jgi:hypothetical protein
VRAAAATTTKIAATLVSNAITTQRPWATAKPTNGFFQKRKGREDPLTAALSTISITAIETVSAARAIRAALRNGTPPVTSGRSVSEYPKKRRA